MLNLAEPTEASSDEKFRFSGLSRLRSIVGLNAKMTFCAIGVLVFLGILAGVVISLARPLPVDQNFDSIDRALNNLKQVDTQWNSDLLNLEMGLENNDDQVSRYPAIVRADLATVEAASARLQAAGRIDPGVAASLANCENVMTKKIEIGEHVKSHYAILANSSRFVPTASVDVINAIANDGRPPEMQVLTENMINRVLAETMSFGFLGDGSVRDRVRQDVNLLRDQTKLLDPGVRSEADMLAMHIDIILRERDIAVRQLSELVKLPVTPSIDGLRAAYQDNYKLILLRQQLYDKLLLAIVSLMVVDLACIGWILWRVYSRLDQSNALLQKGQEEAQQQLIQSAKMSALGQMVAGVAHEINTPLAYVGATFNLLRDLLAEALADAEDHRNLAHTLQGPGRNVEGEQTLQEDIGALLNDGLHGVEQISALVRSMKNFSRTDREMINICAVQDIIDGAFVLTHHKTKHIADVQKDYQKTPSILCSSSQISQVFVNLINNAADAMADRSQPGRLHVKLSQDSKDMVRIDITDNGSGIPDDMLPTIFDPFMTTKPVGEGTGLGLPICYRIVHNHGGTIEVASQVGVGTTFSVILPIRNVGITPASKSSGMKGLS